jgi:hypothetical protein
MLRDDEVLVKRETLAFRIVNFRFLKLKIGKLLNILT